MALFFAMGKSVLHYTYTYTGKVSGFSNHRFSLSKVTPAKIGFLGFALQKAEVDLLCTQPLSQKERDEVLGFCGESVLRQTM